MNHPYTGWEPPYFELTEEQRLEGESRCTDTQVPAPTGPHLQSTKDAISDANKKSWAKDEDRRHKLIEWNKTVHAKRMKESWASKDHPWKDRVWTGRPKGSKDLKQRKQRPQRQVIHNQHIYADAKEAAIIYGVHPVTIRRKCKEQIEGFRYA